MRLGVSPFLALVLLVPACDESPNAYGSSVVDQGGMDGDGLWKAAYEATSLAQAGLAPDGADASDDGIVVACPQGGDLVVRGIREGTYEFDLDIEMQSCTANNITMDGDIALIGTVLTTDEVVERRVEYRGTIVWGGTARINCELDTDLVLVTATGAPVDDQDSFLTGTICGHDAQTMAHTGT